MLIPEGLPVPEPQPVLADISSYARPITVAGPAPTTAQGQWGDALHFAGGRLETPQIELPLTHNLSAWLKPDGRAGEQVILDIGGVARFAYDGTNQRLTYTIVDGGGQAITTATPPGSFPASSAPRFVAAGRAKTGELVVAIAGTTYCNSTKVNSVARGDGVTPITFGSAAGGGRPFYGVIEYPGFGPSRDQQRRLPADLVAVQRGQPARVRVLRRRSAVGQQRLHTAAERPEDAVPRRGRADADADATATPDTDRDRAEPTPTATPADADAHRDPDADAHRVAVADPTSTPVSTPTPTPTPSVPVAAPPVPSITAPAAYSWSRSRTLTLNGSSRGTVAVGSGTWSKTFTGVPTGTRTFTAKATDYAGNVSAISAGYYLPVG